MTDKPDGLPDSSKWMLAMSEFDEANKPARTKDGKFRKGFNAKPSQWLDPLKEALRAAVTPDQVKETMAEMCRLSTKAKDEKVRVEAGKVILERIFGRVRHIHVVESEKQIQSIVNVEKLTPDELETMIRLGNKTLEALPPGADDTECE